MRTDLTHYYLRPECTTVDAGPRFAAFERTGKTVLCRETRTTHIASHTEDMAVFHDGEAAQRAAACMNALKHYESPHAIVIAARILAAKVTIHVQEDAHKLPADIVDAVKDFQDVARGEDGR